MRKSLDKKKTSHISLLALLFLVFTMTLSSCGGSVDTPNDSQTEIESELESESTSETEAQSELPTEQESQKESESQVESEKEPEKESQKEPEKESEKESESKPVEKPAKNTPAQTASSGTVPKLSSIPKYSGKAYVSVNKNKPYFTDKDLVTESYEYYSKLDSYGRCGVVVACIGKDIMPTEERGSIGSVKPTGWHTVKYDNVDGKYLYNRCHLLGYQLTGENANTKNLITGTRYLNVDGMLPFENMVADYVKETGNHVLLRVTPIFDGKNLLASGVLMEAKSVEDNGEGILFNVFCYNVQPGIIIDYSDGSSKAESTSEQESEATSQTKPETESESKSEANEPSGGTSGKYAVNGKNGKIHMVGECSATGDGKNAMTDPIYFDTYEEALAYVEKHFPKQKTPQCGNCW